MIKMDNLKELLFKNAFQADREFQKSSKIVPDSCLVCCLSHCYDTYFVLIKNAGLEAEYEKWKLQQEQ